MKRALAIAMVLVAAVALPAFASATSTATQKIDAASMATMVPNDVGTTQITAIQDAKTAIDTGQEGTIVTAKTSEDVKAMTNSANGTSMATMVPNDVGTTQITAIQDAKTAFTTTKSTAGTAQKVEGRITHDAAGIAVLVIG